MHVDFLTGGSVIGVTHVIFHTRLGKLSFTKWAGPVISVSFSVARDWGWDWERSK